VVLLTGEKTNMTNNQYCLILDETINKWLGKKYKGRSPILNILAGVLILFLIRLLFVLRRIRRVISYLT